MNYTQLVTAIQQYTENRFKPEDINAFIGQAEQRIYNSVQMPATKKNSSGQLTASNRFLSTPADWLSNFSLAVIKQDGSTSYLLNKDVNFIRESFPNPAEVGVPEYYAVFDEDTFILAPTPNQDYSVEIEYFAYPQSIVVAGTSWLGDNVDAALLYGALLEAYTYMKGEPDVMAMYKERYTEALIQLKQMTEGKVRQDAYRSGQTRFKVQ